MASVSTNPTSRPIVPVSKAITVGQPTSVGQPVNGATQLFIGPPAGKAWRIKSLRSIYTCDSNVGARTLVASFTSASLGDVWSAAFGTVAQANHTIEVSGGDSGSPGQFTSGPTNGGEGLTQVLNFSWPSVWITSDVTMRVWMFFGIGAGDTFSSAQILVEEVTL